MQDQMASPAPATSDLEVAATHDQAVSSSTGSDKEVVSSIHPTTDTAPTVTTGQDKQNAPPAPTTPSEKTASPAPETSEKPAKPKHQIPKSRAIASDQIGMKILYPPENSTKTHKIEVE
jgi:hypothetical protein